MTDTPDWQSPGTEPPGGRGQPPQPMPPYPPPPHPYFAAAKPGVIPLRPLNVGEILDGAISTMRSYPMVMLGVAAIVVAVSQLIAFPFVLPMMDDLNRMGSGEVPTEAELLGAMGATFQAGAVSVLIGILARVFLTGFLTTVVGKAVLGRPAGFGEVWATTKPKLLRLLGLTLLYLVAAAALVVPVVGAFVLSPILGVVLALAALVIAIGLYVLFALSTPALVLEDTTIWRALGRSRQLVRPNFGRVFGITLLAGIIVAVIAAIIQLPFEFVGGGLEGMLSGEFAEITVTYLALSAIGTVVASTITEPFAAGVTALLYTDQRMRREGLDIELARHADAAPGP